MKTAADAGNKRPKKAEALQKVVASKLDGAATYKENEIVGPDSATDKNAYLCYKASCAGKTLTEEAGWFRLSKTAIIKTADEQKAAIKDCYDFSFDVPFRGDDLVTIDKAVFKCNPKRADECG